MPWKSSTFTSIPLWPGAIRLLPRQRSSNVFPFPYGVSSVICPTPNASFSAWTCNRAHPSIPMKTRIMTATPRNPDSEVIELRTRLAEAEETVAAIRQGAGDALVVEGPKGDQIFTLQGAEKISLSPGERAGVGQG